MSNYTWCHGPECHTHETQSRIRGSGDNKVLRTIKIKQGRYNGYQNGIWDYFCNQSCLMDFIREHLTEENAWIKDYDWRGNADESHRHFFYNKITKERRPLTQEQYEDSNYTLNTI